MVEPVEIASAQEPGPAEESASTGTRRTGRRWVVLAAVLVLCGLMGSSLAAGWWLASDRNLAQESALPSGGDAPEVADKDTLVMPDLRGLPIADSRQVVADLGVPSASVEVSEEPAAGEVGVVLSQKPVHGYEVEGDVVLVVSAAATVPQTRGRDATAVLGELERLGARVNTVSRFVPGAAVGSIASIDPRPGQRLPADVEVVIATQPDEVDLSLLDSVDYGCSSTEDLEMNGRTFATGLTCDPYPASDGDPLTQSYVVGRAAETLSGVLGVPDDAEPGTRVALQVLADGRVVAETSAAYGSTSPFTAQVRGALRLTLRLTTPGDDYAQAGLGQLRLVGDPAAMARLQDDP